MFTEFRCCTLSRARWIQSVSLHPVSYIDMLTAFSHIGLHLPSRLFPSGFPAKMSQKYFIDSMRSACHAHLMLLDFNICWIFQIMSRVQPEVTSCYVPVFSAQFSAFICFVYDTSPVTLKERTYITSNLIWKQSDHEINVVLWRLK
jgi:hypothetical protein